MKLALRTDGTIVYVDSPDGPYHVVSKDVDPFNQYDLDELLQYAVDHPEDVVPEFEPKPLEQVRAEALAQVEGTLPLILEKGFMYGTDRIQADPVAQQNATGFLTAVSAGVPVPFPIEWRTKANTSVWIDDLDEFKTFAAMMLGFVQQVFHDTWKVKDDVRSATDIEEIDSLTGAYRSKYGL
jgi:hypothetical protein